jgi:DnaJ like chaperone protein
MGNFAKWIAGGLGWAFFGPVGGIVGFVIGSFIEPQVSVQRFHPGATTAGDFALSLLILV